MGQLFGHMGGAMGAGSNIYAHQDFQWEALGLQCPFGGYRLYQMAGAAGIRPGHPGIMV